MDRPIFPNVSVEYFNILVSASAKDKSELITNPDQQHAEAALIFLYAKAKKRVRILSGDMFRDGKHTLKLKEKWEKIIFNPEIKLEVIIDETDQDKESYRLKLLKDNLGAAYNNSLHELDRDYYTKLVHAMDNHKPFHFTLVDDRAYRFEYDTINHKAYLNFNDVDAVKRLNSQFEKLIHKI